MTFRRRMLSTVPPYLMPWSEAELAAIHDFRMQIKVMLLTWDAVMK